MGLMFYWEALDILTIFICAPSSLARIMPKASDIQPRNNRRPCQLVLTEGRKEGRTDVPFWKAEKTWFLGISQKVLNIFFWLILVPTEDFWRHLLEVSELEKSEIFPLKNRLTLFSEKAEKNILFRNISKTT